MDGSKSIPWADDEFVVYRGFRLVYHLLYDHIFIHFPGGATYEKSELKDLVHMPRRMRGRG